MKIKYINGDPHQGLLYDWRKILKRVHQLGIPKEFFTLENRPIDEHSWLVFLSERTAGKTTGALLLALVMYEMYGTVTTYVRLRKTQIGPTKAGDIFNVIVDNGYIERITEGRYNNITLYRRKWYLCNTVDGEVVDKDPNPCVMMTSVDESESLKSGTNLPTGDLIILDEFVVTSFLQSRPDDFLNFCNIVSTIFRLRECGKIILLGNNINEFSQFYADLSLTDAMRGMCLGDHASVSINGTKIWVEMIKPEADFVAKKASWVKRFMAFDSPEIASITGRATWAVKNYPHIPEGDYKTEIVNIYVSDSDKLARLEIVTHDTLGVCMYVHWATRTYPDSIILTVDDIYDPRQHYGRGPKHIAGLWVSLKQLNKVYYEANDVGSFIDNYEQKI